MEAVGFAHVALYFISIHRSTHTAARGKTHLHGNLQLRFGTGNEAKDEPNTAVSHGQHVFSRTVEQRANQFAPFQSGGAW